MNHNCERCHYGSLRFHTSTLPLRSHLTNNSHWRMSTHQQLTLTYSPAWHTHPHNQQSAYKPWNTQYSSVLYCQSYQHHQHSTHFQQQVCLPFHALYAVVTSVKSRCLLSATPASFGVIENAPQCRLPSIGNLSYLIY